MEYDPRPFEAVQVRPINAELGRDRFTKDDIHTPPPISYWRNNLTALSHRYNLYFIASKDAVAVYQPQFPYQRLYRTPQLLIPATLANPDARGYIDPNNPHAVNHLIVGDLGNEEILLLATDSGNVTAYHTKSIEEAIRKDPYRFSTNARSDYVGVRAFFSQWVFESAWGLAIHTQSRMIAVSANTPHHVENDDETSKITVFAFALIAAADDNDLDGGDASQSDGNQAEWHDWAPGMSTASLPNRELNHRITLGGADGHEHNIPSIAFVNSAEDPGGNWLLSTDIGGEMKTWQIWQNHCYKTWDFADQTNFGAPWLPRREGGWLVAALQPPSFRHTKSMHQFCGHKKAPLYYGHLGSGENFDLTNIVRQRTPGNNQLHPTISRADDGEVPGWDEELASSFSDSESEQDSSIGSSAQTLGRGHVIPAAQLGSTMPSSSDGRPINAGLAFPQTTAISMNASRDTFGSDAGVSVPTRRRNETSGILADVADFGSDEDMPDRGQPSDSEAVLGESFELEATMSAETAGLEVDDMEPNSDPDNSDTDNGHDDRSPASVRSTTSASSLNQRTSEELERANFVASTVRRSHHIERRRGGKRMAKAFRNMYYSRPTGARAQGDSSIPSIPTLHCSTSHLRLLDGPQSRSAHVFCARLLRQLLPPGLEATQHAQLDRLNMLQQIPELGIVVIATQIGRCAVCSLTRKGTNGLIGLRVDWILPTLKQELKGMRPLAPLLGLAVGPIQGRMPAGASPTPANDAAGSWCRDRVVEDVPTSFEPHAVILDSDNELQESSSQDDADQTDRTMDTLTLRKNSRRKRHSPQRADRASMPHRTKEHDLSLPASSEPWKAAENSRRCRLMMTYADMTVLTYELSTGVERDDLVDGNTTPSVEREDSPDPGAGI